MIVRISLKDPDGFFESVKDAVEGSLDSQDQDENEAVAEIRTEKVWKALAKWVRYQEYVEIEFDTDAGTATVVEAKS